MRRIQLIFTRDFDQAVQEIIRNSLVLDCPKIWGRGLKDQMVYFNGRTFRWYRYVDDMEGLRRHLTSLPLKARIFHAATQRSFIKAVQELRRLTATPAGRISRPLAHFNRIKELFYAMYPYYPLGIFIAGPWREEFLRQHGPDAQPVLKQLYHSRETSEGLLKVVGNHLREWLGPELESYGYRADYVRLLTVHEITKFLSSGLLPGKIQLAARAKGYFYLRGRLVNGNNFKKLLLAHKLSLSSDRQARGQKLRGAVAYMAPSVRGVAQVILNSYEMNKFKRGNILVTPMTSPDYLAAMKGAKAIITDEGGLTCHAAITARELKKLCVIGTKYATQLIKDGDRIAIDREGTIRFLKP